MVNFRDIYDVTARDRARIEQNAARRIELRNEYLKKFHTPYKPLGGIMFDEPVQRFMSLRQTRREYTNPTLLGWLYHCGLIFVPIVLFTMLVKKERDTRNHQLRTGQISYRDRFNKFI